MCKTDYLLQQLQHNDIIWIDTCTMMYTRRFESFIQKVRPLLIELNKKIQVPDCVMAELAKHQLSTDSYKQTCATEALNIIKLNNDIFKIERIDNDASNGENFADPKILTVILEKRRNIPQLLISNDQRLTSDAYKFNEFESFYGNKVSVCYIDSNGEMNMCDCVKSSLFRHQQEKVVYKDKIIEKEVIRKIPHKKSFIESFGFPIGILTGCVGTYAVCNYNKITRYLKELF